MLGVSLNNIEYRRASLTEQEATVVWLLHWNGDIQSVIAGKLGTNSGRVADVLTEKTHMGSQIKANILRSG